MIGILLIVLLCIVIGIALFELIQVDAGYVLISVSDTTIESSFWFALFSLFVFLIILFVVYFVLSRTFRTLAQSQRWFSIRHHAGIERRYRDGLLHFLVGNYQESTKLLQSVSRRPELPVVRAIATAQAKARVGQTEAALNILNVASEDYPDDVVWITFAKVGVLTELQRYDEAKALIEYLKELKPKDKFVLALEQRSLVDAGQWTDALELSSASGKKLLLDSSTMEQVYINNLNDLVQEAQPSSVELDKVWQQVPRELKGKEQFKVLYARILNKVGDEKVLSQYLLKTLKQSWNADLADMYAKNECYSEKERLKQLEHWLDQYGENATLLLLLGIMSLKNQLWGKAKSYLEKSLALGESAKTLYMLGYLAEKMDDEKLSLVYYRRSASMSQ